MYAEMMAVIMIFSGFIFSILTGIFSYKSALFLDPDFGWQLRTGQHILSNHWVPSTDPFTYSMPSFPLIAHSWLSDVLFAYLYPFINYTGLAVLVSAVAILSLLLVTPKKHIFYMFPILIFHAGLLIPYGSVRPQVFSWLYFAYCIIAVTSRYKNTKNDTHFLISRTHRYLLIPATILAVNLHAGFSAGYALVIFFLLMPKTINENAQHITTASQPWSLKNLQKYFISNRQNYTYALLLTVTTFINPYGYTIWREVFLTTFDPGIRLEINEWIPAIISLNTYYAPALAISLVLYLRYNKIFSPAERGLYLLTAFAGLTSTKLFPFWIIVSVYTSCKALAYFYENLPNKESIQRFRILVGLLALGAIPMFIFQTQNSLQTYTKYRENVYYPKNAVDYLSKNPVQGNLLSQFSWGGYLIWKYPQKKVFVDGRMTYWEQSPNSTNNYLKMESPNGLDEYRRLVTGEAKFDPFVKKYGITHILFPSHDKNYAKIIRAVEKNNWKKVYSDKVSVIYSKN